MKLKKPIINVQYNSPVILTFALVSLLVLLVGRLTSDASTSLFFCVYRSSWADFLTYIRLFGHVLGHASWSHFSSNMVLFLVLGPMLEEKYGSKPLLAMMVITAVVSGVAHLALFPNTALLGASGIVFMMIVLSSAAGMENGKIPITLILVIVIYLGSEVMQSLDNSDGIAHITHIVGGICGAGFGVMMNRKRKG
jgi:membrane associated rhomboid family serine protease